MAKRTFELRSVEPWPGVSQQDWNDWRWQMRQSLNKAAEFQQRLELSASELVGFQGSEKIFRIQTTPYYFSLISPTDPHCPIRQMILPKQEELLPGLQQMTDPLGENKSKNRPCQRLIHRYTDRALFLVTDMCGVYCRYCTRKHFTASDQVLASQAQLEEVLRYLRAHSEIKEVIFSGGDPLTLGTEKLEHFLQAIYAVPSVELIRIGTRMPVALPMRIDVALVQCLKKYQPIYIMTHFNHPDEITQQSAEALERLVDHGIPVFNQLVLLNGINNHPALIYALSRRLLALRVKPHYMFQADPSIGTDHLRTSIEDSLAIQQKLWGHASGLAMPTFIVDIPDGGGKAALTPNFQMSQSENTRRFQGWDGVVADYHSPKRDQIIKPVVAPQYQQEWNQ